MVNIYHPEYVYGPRGVSPEKQNGGFSTVGVPYLDCIQMHALVGYISSEKEDNMNMMNSVILGSRYGLIRGSL